MGFRISSVVCASVLALAVIVCGLPLVVVAQGQPSGQGAAAAAAAGALPSKSSNLRVTSIEGTGTANLISPPVFSYTETTIVRSRTPAEKWGRITIQYDTAPKWIDQLTIKYFVMLKSSDKDSETPYSLLDGSVTYVDVKLGNGHKAEVYIRPRTLERYGEVIGVAAVLSYKDETVSLSKATLKDLTGDWWVKLASHATVTPRSGYIISREETPFSLINFQDYEVVSR